jgi:pimeloyl-ACP methyl ester carboxylesterase
MRWIQLSALPAGLAALPLLAAACAPQPEAPTEQVSDAHPAPATRATIAASDGVPVVAEIYGSGDIAVVLVHCWACNRAFWREQVKPVAEAGYQVVVLDLPGHGESGAAREEWSIAGLGADVEAVVEALDLEQVVMVGHSMGGPVSLVAASLMPARVTGVVCVDTLHNADFEWQEGMVESITRPLEKDYRAGMESFVRQLFEEGSDPQLVEWVIDQAVESSTPTATIALMRSYPNWDAPAALESAGVPIRCINASPLGEQGFTTEVEVNRKYADFDVTLMDAVGHYPQLERPAEFNEILLATLAGLAKTP